MKKYILYYLTSFCSVWLVENLLSGIKMKGDIGVFLLSATITIAVWVSEYIYKLVNKKKFGVFILVSVFSNFFTIYIASLLFKDLGVSGGSLKTLNLEILETPSVKSVDSILTLLLAGSISTFIASLTRWAIGVDKFSAD